MRLAVLGGGHGALCMAADLSLAGHELRLYLRNRGRFAQTFATRRIGIGGAGRTGEAAVSLVTDEVGQALDGAEMVLVPLPAYAHEDIARRAAPHLKAGQVVYLTPGTFGSFVFAKTVREAGGPAIVTAEALARIKSVYEVAEPVTDALDSALLNVNGALHASLTIMNAGPIESMEAFDIHREGSTPAILRVMAALEGERIALRKALGYPPPHWPIMDYYAHRDWLYGVRGRQLVEQQSVWHEKIDLRGRYVEEDVRFGLALW